MKRKATEIFRSDDGRYQLFIDDLNSAEILTYLESSKRHSKKFRFIKEIILTGQAHDCFKKEDIDATCKDVYAMRLFVGQENDRIYCKKIPVFGRIIVVVACELHLGKKTRKLSNQEKALIRKVASYEYDF